MNAHELSLRMASDAAAIAQYLLPGGKRKAGEWTAGNTTGEAGQSLSVRLTGAKAGVWKDFANGEGGDLLDLWAACRGCSIAEAINEAKAYLGVRETMPAREKPSFKRPQKPQCQAAKSGALEWLKGRGLTDETIAAFKIAEQMRNGNTLTSDAFGTQKFDFILANPPFPRKLACWPLGCGCDVDAGPGDVEAWALAA